MDTKLKSFNRSTGTKAIAFLLIVLLLSSLFGLMLYGFYSGVNPEVLFTKEYLNSESYQHEFRNIVHSLDRALSNGDESIPDGISYYGTRSGQIIASSLTQSEEELVRRYQSYYHLDNGILTKYENFKEEVVSRDYSPSGSSIFIVFHEEFFNNKQSLWESGRELLVPIVIAAITMVIGIISLLTYLFIVTGKKPKDEEIHFNFIDKIYTEIMVISLFGVIVLWVLLIASTANFGYPMEWLGKVDIMSRDMVDIYLIIGSTGVTASIAGVILLSIVRRFKGKVFLKTSFIYSFIYKGFMFVRNLMDGSKFENFSHTMTLHKRQIYFVGGSFLLVFLTMILLFTVSPLSIIPPILEVVLIYWYFKYNKDTFEEINKGYDESLQEQMKAERMKINLVTNVSHDLKTPLTSIISYVDLLSREEDLSDTAKDYVRIISDKSIRLKNIVADLFDLAKSTSGDINLEMENLDLKKLVQQTLVDLDDVVKGSGFLLKTQFPDEPVNILSDGKKLYRVVQNLIDNALKYSLEGSRIYVDLSKHENKGILSIKNTANYEMEFTKEEILQRFFRGDQSRGSEGSGLGLSIAESFTQVCGGNFKIEIDGDQFKVTLKFNLI